MQIAEGFIVLLKRQPRDNEGAEVLIPAAAISAIG